MRAVVVWFRNDLRVTDQALWKRVREEIAKHPETVVVPVYCCDPRHGSRFSPLSKKFRLECVNDLGRNLEKKCNLPLLVFQEEPHKVLKTVVQSLDCKGVVLTRDESCSEERADDKNVQNAIKSFQWRLERIWDYSMFHPADLPFDIFKGQVSDGFTSMRKRIEEANVPIRDVLEDPNGEFPRPSGLVLEKLLQLPNRLPAPMETEKLDSILLGGETAALERLEEFCRDGLATYKLTRNDSLGMSYSSKLSPYLAAGCISPRQIVQRVRQFEKENGGETVDTYWVVFELMWRDFLRFFAIKHGDKIFHSYGVTGKDSVPKQNLWKDNPEAEHRWKTGTTGIPWVDAHMRQLVATGFMSNRGRQNVASFLVNDLGIDWRIGAAFFEHHLLDHDVTSNYCNWISIAGLDSPRSYRSKQFNMAKQASQYDKDGKHALYWIPELRAIPGDRIHNLDFLQRVKVNKNGYPNPIVQRPQWKPSNDSTFRGKKQRKGRAHKGQQHVFITK